MTTPSLELHERLRGKIAVEPKMTVDSAEDLALVYSPGVAEPSTAIANDPDAVWRYTIKGNTVAVVTDGTAVLGLGDIGPLAALPVMEGKAMLFKQLAGIDAFPICLATTDVDEIVDTVRRIAPSFGGINLEDISAPRSFEVEARLQDIGIPVFHDDQHGTAVVALAALMNAARVVGKELTDMTVVVSGAGAAGIAISRLLRCTSIDPDVCKSVGDVLVTDSKGIISSDRADLSPAKQELLGYSNRDNRSGSVHDAIVGADAFIGVSAPNVLDRDDVRAMADSAIVFGLANPDPEIMPAEALAAGAAIAGTGRSDLPNQVNNVLGFPGIFRGALDARATRITPRMNLAAADAIAASISDPTPDRVLPAALDASVAQRVAAAVAAAV